MNTWQATLGRTSQNCLGTFVSGSVENCYIPKAFLDGLARSTLIWQYDYAVCHFDEDLSDSPLKHERVGGTWSIPGQVGQNLPSATVGYPGDKGNDAPYFDACISQYQVNLPDPNMRALFCSVVDGQFGSPIFATPTCDTFSLTDNHEDTRFIVGVVVRSYDYYFANGGVDLDEHRPAASGINKFIGMK